MRKKRKTKYLKILYTILSLVIIFWLGSETLEEGIVSIQDKQNNRVITITQEIQDVNIDNTIPGFADKIIEPKDSFQLSIDKLYSSNAILIRLDDSKVILDKKSEEQIYPASLTKIMTAIVAIENITDLQQYITLPTTMFEILYEENASMAGFLPEEEVQVIDLLYGALLPSGAECCIGLADMVAGSEQEFTQLMNNKAKELGMDNSNFTNSTGLHNSKHYTTVMDLAKLLQYALNNETFMEIFTSVKHTTASTNLHPDGITLYSSMFSKMDSAELVMEEILGGKTGYTEPAGLCLASYAYINNKRYILVTTGADGNTKTEQKNIFDAYEVYKELKAN
jgi:D-alanyl-D-alanine carboxypeptidase (penicillin-binding protein 5/6)